MQSSNEDLKQQIWNKIKPLPTEWVIGRFEGDQAKTVAAHADAGLAYIILARDGTRWILAAFRRPLTTPRPEYLQAADEKQVQKLEATARIGKSSITWQEYSQIFLNIQQRKLARP